MTGKRGGHELRRLAGRRRFIDLRDQLDRLIAAGDRSHIGGDERFDALCQDSGSRFKAWIEEDRLRVILDPVVEKIRPSALLPRPGHVRRLHRAAHRDRHLRLHRQGHDHRRHHLGSAATALTAAAWTTTAGTDGREGRIVETAAEPPKPPGPAAAAEAGEAAAEAARWHGRCCWSCCD